MDFWPQETFYRNQPVCVTGDLDYVPPGQFVPTADIYVTANSIWQPGDRAIDVTGSPSRFQSLGTFYDQYAWLPTLEAGRYDILIDNDLNGTWDPAHDILLGAGADYAFDVIGTDLAGYSFDSAGVKAQAQAQVGGRTMLHYAPQVAGAVGWAGVGVDAVRIQHAAGWRGNQARHYQNLADDPADPAYGQPVRLELATGNDDLADQLAAVGRDESYPFSPLDCSTEHARQVRIVTLSAEQAALTDAVTHANERYLGAQGADDVRWAVAHALELEQYTAQLVANQQELVDLLQDVRDDAALQPGADDPIDVAALRDLQRRVVTTGFTPPEVTDYESIGYGSV